jgi:hypothetical protein
LRFGFVGEVALGVGWARVVAGFLCANSHSCRPRGGEAREKSNNNNNNKAKSDQREDTIGQQEIT